MKNIIGLSLWLYGILVCANPLALNTSEFDIKQANQTFDHINLQLSVQNLNLNHLRAAVNTLNQLTIGADECVEEMQKKMSSTELLIEQGKLVEKNQNNSVDLVYLTKEHKKLMNRQAQCRLFSIRAKEAIQAYKAAMAQFKQEQALTHGMPIWTLITQFTKNYSFKTIAIDEAMMNPLPNLSWGWFFFSLVFSAGLAYIILWAIYTNVWLHQHLRFKQIKFSHGFLLCIFLETTFLWSYQQIVAPDGDFSHVWSRIFFVTWAYFGNMLLIIFLFKLKKIRRFFHWNTLFRPFFQTLALFIVSFYALFRIANILTQTLGLSGLITQLSQSLFLLLELGSGIYLIAYFCRSHQHLHFIKTHTRLVQRTSAIILFIYACINCLGYQALAIRLTVSSFLTLICIFVMLISIQGIGRVYHALTHHHHTDPMIRRYFGYRKNQTLTEFAILKTTLQFIVIACGIFYIGESWDFATDAVDTLYKITFEGLHISNMVFYPGRVVLGIILFSVLYLVFRALATAIGRHQQFDDAEEDTQVALASLLTYSGFGIALLVGLLVAGFNFTGLAIVAGALSVGIGLGLQSIVNNFVSGLILLIEKPIKPGDRISVDGIEGFVKKIQVRSTQIISPYREDIIIPNSDLITRRVTNYMFSDKFGRVNCEVGVAYHSDTSLVRQLLLDIAHAHDEVIKTGSMKPTVLFRSFGENKLVFQLWCLILDVNKKSAVQSDINFAIEQSFREHQIEMAPSPTMRVTIKEPG